jgi:hypothetical protein
METSKGGIVNDVARVLNDAADLIEQDGWCRERTRGPNGERCAVMAIVEASHHYVTTGDAVRALETHAGSRKLGRWNDAQPGPQPVIAALRAAARSVDQP